MDIQFIIKKIKKEEYDLSSHAHRERQEEQITIDELEKNLLDGDIIEMYINDPKRRKLSGSRKDFR